MNNSGKGRRAVIIIGCIALCVLPVLAIFYISRNTSPSPAAATTPPPAPGTTVPVVVTSDSIPLQTPFTTSNLTVIQRPVPDLPPAGQYYSSIDALTSTQHFAVVTLASNTIVQPNMVATTSQGAQSASVHSPLLSIAAGDVALSIPYQDATGAGGYLQSGDRIDIAVDETGEGKVGYLFEDVLILKVGSISEQGTGTTSGSPDELVVQFNRSDALQMMSILDSKATPPPTIRYLLRSNSDYGKGILP